MVSKADKITHHVRNEMKNLGMTTEPGIDESAIENIIQRLKSKYKEYESYPMDKFTASVREAINSIAAETTITVRI